MSLTIGDTRRVSIVGAGLAGTLLAVMLGRRGFTVDLFERFPDMRQQAVPAGRSINLALAERGRHALQDVGLLQAVDEFTIPMRGRMLHHPGQEPVLQPYGKDDSEVIYSVHRERLNRCLLDGADATGNIRCWFSHALDGVDFERNVLSFTDADGKAHEHPFEVLIGADGGGSRVRHAMIGGARLGLREDLLEHGYKELSIAPGYAGAFQLDPNALHIWPRGGYMMIALPNADGSFTVTLFLSRSEQPGFDHLQDWPAQQAFLQEQFPDVYPLLANAREEFANNPVGLLGTIRCDRWQFEGKALLLGDAAHAIVPFHGQGMNAAFEDCTVLTELLDATGFEQSWDALFQEFERIRRPDAHAIAEMALENYRIMRDDVRAPGFLLRKALEHELERRHPRHFVARYSLVMFHRLPYATALARGMIQGDILDRLLNRAASMEEVDFELAEALIRSELTELPANH